MPEQHWERNCRIASVVVHNLRTGETKGATTAARVLDLHPVYVMQIARRMWWLWHQCRYYGGPGWHQWLELSNANARRLEWPNDYPMTAIGVERHAEAQFRFDERYTWPAAPKSFDDWWDDRWNNRPAKHRDRFWVSHWS